MIGVDLLSWMGIPGVALLPKGPLAKQCQMLFDSRYSIGRVEWSLNFLVFLCYLSETNHTMRNHSSETAATTRGAVPCSDHIQPSQPGSAPQVL